MGTTETDPDMWWERLAASEKQGLQDNLAKLRDYRKERRGLVLLSICAVLLLTCHFVLHLIASTAEARVIAEIGCTPEGEDLIERITIKGKSQDGWLTDVAHAYRKHASQLLLLLAGLFGGYCSGHWDVLRLAQVVSGAKEDAAPGTAR